jgi:hypothetical protein
MNIGGSELTMLLAKITGAREKLAKKKTGGATEQGSPPPVL